MKILIQLEELAKVILAYWLSIYIGYAWWVFLALILVPDLSMIGYIIGSKTGACIYNFAHHQGIAISVGLLGFSTGNSLIVLMGLILFGHSALDRMFGYGLKYEDDFKHTHLGMIGKRK